MDFFFIYQNLKIKIVHREYIIVRTQKDYYTRIIVINLNAMINRSFYSI